MSEGNLQSNWYALLFTSFADAGVRDVVISPGSRSTPLVAAAVAEKRLTRHTIIDERAAAFFALGQARVTGVPSVLVCTSGTAPAHYLPAIIEAGLSGIPLLIVSGDRPPELYECRAPQTIDQVKMFGDQVRAFFDLVPGASDAELRALRRVAAQAVLGTRWPRAGAVHLNARARKPLEPAPAVTDEEKKLEARTRAIASSPLPIAPPPRLVPAPDAVRAAAAMARDAKRGVLVAGPAALAQRDAREAVWSLAKETGFVVAADATSQLRFAPRPREVTFLDGFELLLRSQTFKKEAAFDCAIQIGAPPTSGPWEQLVPSIPRIVVAEHGWNDPHATARVMMFGDVGPSCEALAEAVRGAPRASAFHAYAASANEAAWRAVDAEIGAELVEAGAVRSLVARAPEGAGFVIGNSLAVRLVDIYVRAGDRDHAILSQRGASGIDGLVAGAAGAATATGRPLALLLGDVSLLHDATSLALAARVRTPLVVLVLHNGGGRIFEMLPIADAPGLDPAILEHALTTHQTDFAHAAALAGVRYAHASTSAALDEALTDAWSHAGCTLVEARVAGSGAIALSRRVAKAVEAAVAAVRV